MNETLLICAILLAAKTAVECVLEYMNACHVRARGDALPSELAGVVDGETYEKSVRYTLATSRFDTASGIYGAVVLALVLFTGFLPWLFHTLSGSVGATGSWGYALVILAALWVTSLPGLPWDWWHQFVLEARYGFNKSTQGLWWVDQFKGLLVGLIIGWPLLTLILWIAHSLPLWWLWAWLALTVFQLLMLVLYPRLILPLFNKLSPLPEGELRDALMALSDQTGFHASTIQVIDGSKRSGHSNAFFTGFGRFRRIVLYDTLINQLSVDELRAVLAHEIGHYRKGHVPRMIAVSSLMSLAAFGVIAYLAQAPWFLESFGFTVADGLYAALPIFVLGAGIITFWLTPLTNIWSRRNEYQADAFAKAALGSPDALVAGLRKLHTANLSNLTPHPLYSFFHYSHPTLVERTEALNRATP